jgi:hypothetical protein
MQPAGQVIELIGMEAQGAIGRQVKRDDACRRGALDERGDASRMLPSRRDAEAGGHLGERSKPLS